jgi:hypothetical protein
MSFLKELFDGRLRRARAAEGRGAHREAAGLYAEAGRPLEAGRALMQVAERAEGLEERLAAWLDALAILPASAPDVRREAEVKLGRAVLADAKLAFTAGPRASERLLDAAQRLETAGAFGDAAEAFELLGRTEDLARCLELGGDVERLEQVLGASNARDAARARLRRLVSEAELATELGDRDSARRALREAVLVAPEDADLSRRLRELEERWLGGGRVELSIRRGAVTSRCRLVGRLPAVLGRSEADVIVRGGSVSRRHAELSLEGGSLVLRDLGSRNGTLLSGVPIASPMRIDAPSEIGLGEDASVRVSPMPGGGAEVEVLRGLDRGERTRLGAAALPLEGIPASICFEADRTSLVPLDGARVQLGARSVLGRIDLLRGDVLVIDGATIEVLA